MYLFKHILSRNTVLHRVDTDIKIQNLLIMRPIY